ncbi:hypothetical protein FRC16_001383 [Serendipita sp. 398]|nr:hypothetical protein FRC16_001383 [Serendipita sp. 398]
MIQPTVRGLCAALNGSSKYAYVPPAFGVDYLVVGGGVVGLAIARSLALNRPDKTTYIVERHARLGEETSSRNSEVIHGGFYYPDDSYKTKFCLRGRKLLYEYCDTHSVSYKKTGKLVVGLEHQRPYLEDLFRKTQSLRFPNFGTSPASIEGEESAVPARLLTGDEARELEPDLSPDIACALLSPETGIIDSHTYMESLERDITESENGSVVCATTVTRVDAAEDGWVVQMKTTGSHGSGESEAEADAVMARTVINATGLSAPFILNSIGKTLSPSFSPINIWYARGSYASYHGPGVSNVKHLIYPVPETGKNKHSFTSLGTHLTIDLGGNIKFGPDIEWIEPPAGEGWKIDGSLVYDERAMDYWMDHLIASSKQIPSMYQSVRSYLPGIKEEGLQPDYVGIRPKLRPPNTGFQDFVFRKDYAAGGDKKTGGPMISLLGIESPGLTSSLAIGEYVERHLVD